MQDNVDETQLKLYEELLPYAKFLASKFQAGDVLVSQEDVVGELLLEFVKMCDYYKDKDYISLVKLIKRAMANRVSELRYRYYLTSRANAKNNVELDNEYNADDGSSLELHEVIPDGQESLEIQMNNLEFWNSILENISGTTREIVEVLLNPSDRLMNIIHVVEMRASYVNKNGCTHISIKPRHIADALCIKEEDVWNGYKEFCDVIQELYIRDSGV